MIYMHKQLDFVVTKISHNIDADSFDTIVSSRAPNTDLIFVKNTSLMQKLESYNIVSYDEFNAALSREKIEKGLDHTISPLGAAEVEEYDEHTSFCLSIVQSGTLRFEYRKHSFDGELKEQVKLEIEKPFILNATIGPEFNTRFTRVSFRPEGVEEFQPAFFPYDITY